MAVRSARRSSFGKRFEYVSPESSPNAMYEEYSSSDDDSSSISRRKNKVRDSKSVKMLLKHSNTYEKSEEHGYTQPCVRTNRGKRPFKEDYDYELERPVSKKPKCESRNAINARINRERKKAYVAALEEEADTLKQLNTQYTDKIDHQAKTISELSLEVARLKSFLSNNKYLCALVSKLSDLTGLPVTSSLVSLPKRNEATDSPRTRFVAAGEHHPIARTDVNLSSGCLSDFEPLFSEESLCPSFEEANPDDFNLKDFLPYDYSEPTDSIFDTNVGICVHINQNKLSVEFCSLCNEKAASAY